MSDSGMVEHSKNKWEASWMSKSAFERIMAGAQEALAVARGEIDAYRVHYPIIAERREAAGKIGDDNAPQTQGSEIDARRLPDVQAS